MSVASIGPRAHTPLPSDKVMQSTLPTDLPLPVWRSPWVSPWAAGTDAPLAHWLAGWQRLRPSPALGLLLGLSLSVLLWAAIIGFLLAL